MQDKLKAGKFSVADVISSMRDGWQLFRENAKVSAAYASVFALIGMVLLSAIGLVGISPMAIPIAGGFMLVGPILLCGFFLIVDSKERGEQASVADAMMAIKNAPSQLWIIALLCTMLFLVWITDAATLYAFMIGGEHLPYHLPWLIQLQENVIAFELWGSVMGSAIAFIILSVSAFSVPLLYQERCNLVTAVSLSVKTIVINFGTSIFWGLILSIFTMGSILLLPLFIIILPVLAFTSYSLYRRVFPQPSVTDTNGS